MRFLPLAVLLALPATALAQQQATPDQAVGDVAGVRRVDVPPILTKAQSAPYARPATCPAISDELADLNAALGPDLDGVAPKKGGVGKTAKGVLEAVVPFRGLIREVSGAAASDRRLTAAAQAGTARRGFLRGWASARGCRL